jgi:hypothetical protein
VRGVPEGSESAQSASSTSEFGETVGARTLTFVVSAVSYEPTIFTNSHALQNDIAESLKTKGLVRFPIGTSLDPLTGPGKNLPG